MQIKEKAAKIIEILSKIYENPTCTLDHSNNLELLIATRLSAQCKDERVNLVTKKLFATYKNASEYANAEKSEIENIIKSLGLYKTKASDIKKMCTDIVNLHNSEVPSNFDDLLKLSGIGRKTACLMMGECFNTPMIVTDTHCIRISNRLGLTKNKEAFKVEKDLTKIIPLEHRASFCHRLVMFGRDTCIAQKPLCESCPLTEFCVYKSVEKSK